jgi:hypothetical protein
MSTSLRERSVSSGTTGLDNKKKKETTVNIFSPR